MKPVLRPAFALILLLGLIAGLGFASAPSAQAASYSLTVKSCGVVITDKSCTISVTLKKGGRAVSRATAKLQYWSAGSWYEEKSFAIRAGKATTKVKHTEQDRKYRVVVTGKKTGSPFTVRFIPSGFAVNSTGAGHGVGMSQYGAEMMAKAGSSAAEILGHYYPGTQVSRANNPSGKIRVQVYGPPDDVLSRTSMTITGGGFRILDGAGAAVASYAKPGKITIGVSGADVTMSVALADGSVQNQAFTRQSFQVVWDGQTEVTMARVPGSFHYGRLIVTNLKQRPNVVNEVVLNTEYLYGLEEMPSWWDFEALRAQAIVARTFALRQVVSLNPGGGSKNVRADCNCHVFDDTRSQNYIGWKKAGNPGNKPWLDAVNSTIQADASQPNGSSVVILRAPDGSLAETPYFARTGVIPGFARQTTSNADAFGTAPLSYLAGVADPDPVTEGPLAWDGGGHITQAEATKIFGGKVKRIAITERYASGPIKTLTATLVDGHTRKVTKPTAQWIALLGVPSAWITSIRS